MMQTSRFDFEQMLLRVWGTKEDIDLIAQQHFDGAKPLTEDELANLLMGVSAIHDARCQQMFAYFEAMVREGKLK